MSLIVEIGTITGVQNRRRIPFVRSEEGRRPFPDSSVRSTAEMTVLLERGERRRDGVEVGESDVGGWRVDRVRLEVDSEFRLGRKSCVLRL